MSDSESQQGDGKIASSPGKKRFLNGWTPQLEDLMSDWADKAACARWMHERTARIYSGRDFNFAIPLVVMSGLAASGNFALNSVVGDDKEMMKYAQLGLGGLSLVTGIFQTIANTFAYSKKSESHRISAVSWGKFNRLLCIEMRLHPDERTDSMIFLKMFRQELDRLIEQSPEIPEKVINDFNSLFSKQTDLVKPEVTGILEHTEIYKDDGSRLRRIAAEATIALHYKRGIIKQLVEDEIERKTREAARESAIAATKEFLREQADARKPVGGPGPTTVLAARKQERAQELSTIAQQRAGAVAAMRERFRNPIGVASSAARNSLSADNVVVHVEPVESLPGSLPDTSTPETLHVETGVVTTQSVIPTIVAHQASESTSVIEIPDSRRQSVNENEKESS